MILNTQKLDSRAILPTYAHEGDAGMDLYSLSEVKIPAGSRALVGTGVVLEIPQGYVGLIWDKSGLSNNYGLKTLGGVVDAGYRGEVKVGVINLSTDDYTIAAGHKVAQMLIQKVEHPEIVEVAALSTASRGEHGFGSTGK